MKNTLGSFEELEEPMTIDFAQESEKLGYGIITESGFFRAEYPYYGAQWGRQMIYEISDYKISEKKKQQKRQM